MIVTAVGNDVRETGAPLLRVPPEWPLYVDLDGTLHPGDTLWDSVALAIQRRPLRALRLPFVLLCGPLRVKTWLATRIVPDVALLPFRTALVDLCRRERSRGRRVVLATAAHHRIAAAVADHLECFDAVIATDTVNRKGAAKLEAIRADAADRPFLYAGDAWPDRRIWAASAGAIVAGGAAGWRDPRAGAPVLARFSEGGGRIGAVLAALRPHQWVKNILVFLPLLASHRILDPGSATASLIAFLAFCLCASSAYLLNDLLDIENDRAHHRKRFRPLAAGTLPVPWALVLIPGLLAVAFALVMPTAPLAVVVLALYYAVTLAYSVILKHRVLVDVFTLAGLYAIRLLAGHAATGIPYSPWLLGLMTFLFLSLAFAKRHAELVRLRSAGGQRIKGRGYRGGDLELVSMFGVAAGFMAALVMALYVTSDAVAVLYAAPMLLWGLSPLVLYWVAHVWLIAHRGDLHDDPIVFTLRDGTSYVVGLCAAALVAAATFLPCEVVTQSAYGEYRLGGGKSLVAVGRGGPRLLERSPTPIASSPGLPGCCHGYVPGGVNP
jgi:4-hydroxybenzoate polyprenyltransferase